MISLLGGVPLRMKFCKQDISKSSWARGLKNWSADIGGCKGYMKKHEEKNAFYNF